MSTQLEVLSQFLIKYFKQNFEDEMNKLKETCRTQSQTINELRTTVVTLEHEKYNLLNISHMKKEIINDTNYNICGELNTKIETENDIIINLKNDINNLQNDINNNYNKYNNKGMKNLNDKIKILTNDNERLKAINKNEQISFNQRIYEYQNNIAKQIQIILNNNNKQKLKLEE
eukprot:352006_1